ncbi:uncharacterized protein B0I36DRAFT_256787, partial [Microdochium trichocladiopsis]
TSRNSIDLSFATIAVLKGKPLVAQNALVGVLLGNLLVIMGMCFISGGFHHSYQEYSSTMARLNSQMLVVSLMSIIVPTITRNRTSRKLADTQLDNIREPANISHAVAWVLIAQFVLYIFSSLPIKYEGLGQWRNQQKEKNAHMSRLPYSVSIAGIVLSYSAAVASSYFLIEGLAARELQTISIDFLELIVIPLALGIIDQVTIITKTKNQDISWLIDTAVVSSIRVSLFAFPIAVLTGVLISSTSVLAFDTFQAIMLAIAVLLVNYVLHSGKAFWIEGSMLISAYVLTAIVLWHYPIH